MTICQLPRVVSPRCASVRRLAHARLVGMALAGALSVLVAGADAFAEGFSFSVEPTRVELSVAPGKRRGKTVMVDNSRSDQPVHLTAYVRDIVYMPDGTHDFPEPGSTQWSAAKWVDISPKEMDIPAGETADVRVSVAVPEGAAGGYYAMVFFETGPSYAQSGIGVNFRLGSLVEVVIPGTAALAAKLTDFQMPAADRFELQIFNDGNVLFRPGGKIKVFDAQGKRLMQVDVNKERLSILPKTARKIVVPLERQLTPGTYTARAELDYGSRYLLVGELPVTVK